VESITCLSTDVNSIYSKCKWRGLLRISLATGDDTQQSQSGERWASSTTDCYKFFRSTEESLRAPQELSFFFFSEDNRSKAKAEERWMMISTRWPQRVLFHSRDLWAKQRCCEIPPSAPHKENTRGMHYDGRSESLAWASVTDLRMGSRLSTFMKTDLPERAPHHRTIHCRSAESQGRNSLS